MNPFYDQMAKTASGILASKGQTVTVTVKTPIPYDPETSTSSFTTKTRKRKAVVFDFGEGVNAINGEMVMRGDKRCILECVTGDSQPKVGDEVTVGTDVYKVLPSKALAPAGVTVIYELWLRK